MKLLYISISGNTRAFVKRLMDYAAQQPTAHPLEWSVKEIDDNSIFEEESEPLSCLCRPILKAATA